MPRGAKVKKILVVLLVCFVLLCFSSCKCKHEWAEATCTEPMTCSLCGEKQGEPLGHKWSEATCTEPMTCSVCGEKQGNTIAHHYSNATVTINPSCTTDGETTSICEVCGNELKESVNATGHNYVEIDHLSTLHPACETKGRKVEECVNCGDLKYTTLPATGHTLGDVRYRYGNKEVFVCTMCNRSIETKVPKEPGKFFKLGIVDGFGSLESGYYVSAEGFSGTYKKENVNNGKITWKIDITPEKSIIFTIYENGLDNDLSTAFFSGSEYDVVFRNADNEDEKFIGTLQDSGTYKSNEIRIDTNWLFDPVGALLSSDNTSILISNDYGEYYLGSIDTSEIEKLLYNVELNNEIDKLIDEEKYQEALNLLNENIEERMVWGEKIEYWKDSETANHFGFNEKRKKCQLEVFSVQKEEIIQLISDGEIDSALDMIGLIKKANKAIYEELNFKETEKSAYLVQKEEIIQLISDGEIDSAFDMIRLIKDTNFAVYEELNFKETEKLAYDAKYWTPVMEAFEAKDKELMHFYLEDYDAYVPYNLQNDYSSYVLDKMLDNGISFGPAGGYVFFDKGEYSDGWRYLEAAPKEISTIGIYGGRDTSFAFGKLRTSKGYAVVGTSPSIGSGKDNTKALISAMDIDGVANMGSNKTGEYAAKLCDDYVYGGYDDWFLPSIEELEAMVNLYIACIINGSYISSTEYDKDKCFCYSFHYDTRETTDRTNKLSVIPVRAY